MTSRLDASRLAASCASEMGIDETSRPELVDSVDGFFGGFRYLICDRDPLFTGEFRRIHGNSGVNTVKLPPRSPNLNACAERFVFSIKSESLNRIDPLGEQHLRRAVNEFVDHRTPERVVSPRRCSEAAPRRSP